MESYRDRYCGEILDYFARPAQEVRYKKEYYQNGEVKSETPVILPGELPTFQGFAEKIGVSAAVLDAWRRTHPRFREAYERAKQAQERIWLVNSLGGLYNASFAQFFGRAFLGCRDKGEGSGDQEVRFIFTPQAGELAE